MQLAKQPDEPLFPSVTSGRHAINANLEAARRLAHGLEALDLSAAPSVDEGIAKRRGGPRGVPEIARRAHTDCVGFSGCFSGKRNLGSAGLSRSPQPFESSVDSWRRADCSLAGRRRLRRRSSLLLLCVDVYAAHA